MRTVVVGDLHGQHELVTQALSIKDANIIFIGDYLDSFDRTYDDCLECLDMVIAAVVAEPDRVFALKGNHEMSYLISKMQCSGYDYATQRGVTDRLHDMDHLLDYMWVDEYLVSHAGVSDALLDTKNITLEEYLEAGDFTQIGYARGGTTPCGGLFWCDFWREFDPVEGVPQIVGHSHGRPGGADPGIVKEGNAYNIDCLGRVNEVLVLEKGKEPQIKLLDSLL